MTDLQTTPPGAEQAHPLDNAAWASLTGPHAHFAQGLATAVTVGTVADAGTAARVLRYPADVSPFVAVPSVVDETVWAELALLAGPGQSVALSGSAGLLDRLPAGWEIQFQAEAVQLVATDALVTGPDPEAVRLGAADVDDMLDLVDRTRPGPFLPNTCRLGTYLGIRRDDALVAMAGERMHPPGWTEISAVCTDPALRGQGLATRLVRAVAHGIRQRGETPLLHAAVSNTGAIRLYESIGFTRRRRIFFFGLRTPEHPDPA